MPGAAWAAIRAGPRAAPASGGLPARRDLRAQGQGRKGAVPDALLLSRPPGSGDLARDHQAGRSRVADRNRTGAPAETVLRGRSAAAHVQGDPMSKRQRTTSDGLAILDRRHFHGRPARARALVEATLNAQIAQEIYALRTRAGLTQKQLADLVGTTDSVISRLEDADYAGH